MSEPSDRLPPGDFLVYHWSPRDRRESIEQHGLKIRQDSSSAPSLVRYPYVAFAVNPVEAWDMSGVPFADRGRTWDLWAVYASALGGFEIIPTDDGDVREMRTYRSIPARHVRYIATRSRR